MVLKWVSMGQISLTAQCVCLSYLIVRYGEPERREFSLFGVNERYALGPVTVHREVLVLSALVLRRFFVLAAAPSCARA